MLCAGIQTFRAQQIWAGVFDIWPGYLKVPNPADVDLKTYLERTTPKASKPDQWDSFNYWSNTPKFGRLFSEGTLRRRGHKGKRLGLPLHAQGGSQLFLDSDSGTTC